MTTTIRSCALVTRFADARVAESAGQLAAHLAARGIAPLALDDEIDRFDGIEVSGVAEAELAARADLVVAIGGDGTLLYAAGLVAERGTPLLGINRGRLGFLTDVLPADMLASVDAALAGDVEVDQRRLLAAQLRTADGRVTARGLALNDVVIQKWQSGHLLDFETSINGRYVNTHGGDGLVVASATGSTAYALSCGGPIVEPQLDAIVVAPICPHTLSDRPIVVSSRSVVEVRLVERPDTRAEVTCDGRVLGAMELGEALLISPSDHKITLLHPRGYDYFRLLRSKLNWGRRAFDLPR
ncbi:MAG: NAD(+)/NADH kinase [Steroidobacteraceae bacterium]|jgi:NAD+ kinase|nr:NAD(+)/NADH kinase [Steroidobacteraceae bacterium]